MERLAVVTGGTRGIGKAIATRFLEEGFHVIVCSRKESHFTDMQKELSEGNRSRLEFYRADLGVKSEAEAFGDHVLGSGRPVEVLVNNAGIFHPGEVHEEPDGTLENMINVNLYGPYWLSRKLIPQMMEKGRGHIFNMCSTASIIPYTNGGAYCISKFALLGFSKLLRVELMDKGIRVTAVLPGATWTDSWSSSGMGQERFIKAEDVSELIYSTYKLSPSANVEEILIRPQKGDV